VQQVRELLDEDGPGRSTVITVQSVHISAAASHRFARSRQIPWIRMTGQPLLPQVS
jgi:hypothetical protein